jgi:prephenate dehydrogenase
MKVGIVGLGVMGGSLVMALADAPDVDVFVVSRNDQSRSWARSCGAIPVGASQDLPEDLDFCFLATPSKTLSKIASELGHLSASTIISDMASAKSEVVPELTRILKDQLFLSCHPMCGSEKTGLEGAKQDLYKSKTVVLTPASPSAEMAIDKMTSFWEQCGGRCVVMNPEAHDRAVAWVSHMPHMVIPAMVNAISVGDDRGDQPFDVAGTGLRDISRLASSNPELWRDIIMENQASIKIALDGVIEELKGVRSALDLPAEEAGQSLESFLARAKATRQEKGLAQI